jgi:protocatechuate 3,4-dioxygenase beta subunit
MRFRHRSQIAVALFLVLVGAAIVAWPVRERPAETRASSSVAARVPSFATHSVARLASPTLPLASALTGSVRSGTGAPVARASVCVESRPAGAPPRYDGVGGAGACTSTRADGEFEFQTLRPGSYHIRAMEPSTGIAGTSISIEDSRPARVELTLGEGALLTGHVLDVQGGPVTRASILAMQRVPDEASQLAAARAISEDTGAFRVLARPGETVLRIIAEGYADGFVRAHAPATDVDIALVPASRLLGQVVSAIDDTPIAGASVIATRTLPELILREGRAITDEQGHFAIEGLIDGAYDVFARAEGFASAGAEHVELTVAASATVSLRVQKAVALTGVVVTSRGRTPCATADVTIRGTGAEQPFVAHTTSDDAGRVRFANVPPGGYELHASWRGRDASLPGIVITESHHDFTIEVPTGARLVGRVVDSLQAPVSNEGVLATLVDGPTVATRSDAHGRFELVGLAPGSYRLATVSTPRNSVLVDVPESGDAQEIVLERGAMSSLVVKLRHTDGTEVVDAWQVYARGDRVLPAERSDASYRFSSLSAGSHVISAHDGVNAPVEASVELRDAERKEITLLVPRHAGVLHGRVVDERGAPVADAWVRAQASSSVGFTASRERSVLTSTDGTFELAGLAAAGRYTVEAQAAAQGVGSQSDVELGRSAVITLRAMEPGNRQ